MVADESGQRICSKIQNGGGEGNHELCVGRGVAGGAKPSGTVYNIVNIERTWLYTTNTRLCQRNFISLISILAKFVLFEYNHVVGLRETQSYNIDESV